MLQPVIDGSNRGGDRIAAHVVQLVVRGRLGPSLRAALSDFAVDETVDETDGRRTRVTGRVADQAMLLGLLEMLGDLGVEVVSVNRVADSGHAP